MPFVAICPHCRAAFRAADQANGKTLPCSKCQKPFLCRPAPPRPADVETQQERSSLWPAALGGVVLAMLVGTAGLAVVWFQTRPQADPSAVASASSRETKTEPPIPEPESPEPEAPKQPPPP